MTNQSPNISREAVERKHAENAALLVALLDAKEEADRLANDNAVAAVIACEQLRAELAAATRAIARKDVVLEKTLGYFDGIWNALTKQSLRDAIAYTGDDTQCSA